MSEIRNKIILLGDPGVGKTCLITRLTSRKYDPNLTPTVGAGQFSYKYKTPEGRKEVMQIWDTAGSELFRSMTPLYSRNAVGVIIVFDLTKKSTFEGIREWINTLEDQAPILIIGNKEDLSDKREVSLEEALIGAKEFNAEYREASAKSGIGVEEAFHSTFLRALEYTETHERKANVVEITHSVPSKGCC